MCRNIKMLFNFDPPVTDEEIRAASLQFVRKISGFNKPSKANEQVFNEAIDEIAAVSAKLLSALETTAQPKNREDEAAKAKARGGSKLRLLPLLAATCFMASGGPYDLEDVIGYGGYKRALLLLFLLPFFWSFPTALMLGELAAAIPDEGGFYAWVRRALGPFWGFQEAWLSLAASVFDMAVYPTTFVLYLGHIAPAMTAGHRALALELIVV